MDADGGRCWNSVFQIDPPPLVVCTQDGFRPEVTHADDCVLWLRPPRRGRQTRAVRDLRSSSAEKHSRARVNTANRKWVRGLLLRETLLAWLKPSVAPRRPIRLPSMRPASGLVRASSAPAALRCSMMTNGGSEVMTCLKCGALCLQRWFQPSVSSPDKRNQRVIRNVASGDVMFTGNGVWGFDSVMMSSEGCGDRSRAESGLTFLLYGRGMIHNADALQRFHLTETFSSKTLFDLFYLKFFFKAGPCAQRAPRRIISWADGFMVPMWSSSAPPCASTVSFNQPPSFVTGPGLQR